MARDIKEENAQIGQLLQEARKSRKLLQSELCDSTGLTKNHILALERGVSQASIKTLIGYCDKLGCTPNDILKYDDLNLIDDLKILLSAMDEEQQKRIVDMIKLMMK